MGFYYIKLYVIDIVDVIGIVCSVASGFLSFFENVSMEKHVHYKFTRKYKEKHVYM